VCPPGRNQIGSRLVDGIPVAICERDPPVANPPPPGPAPSTDCADGEVFVGSIEAGGGCVPCPNVTVPNASGTACICPPGYIQVGIEGTFGFPVCSPPSGAAEPPPPTRLYEAPADDAFIFGTRFGFGFTIEPQGPLAGCEAGDRGREGPGIAVYLSPPLSGGHCEVTLFRGNLLQPGWSFVEWDGFWIGNCDAAVHDVTRDHPDNPRSLQHSFVIHITPLAGILQNPLCGYIVETITLRGPVGQTWQDAFR
jgi:hypothetical protein